MSRIAKYPVPLPKGVDISVASGQISVKGPLGAVARPADPNVEVTKDGEQLVIKALGNSNHANAMSGTMRALVANMVTGVTKGFEKRLALVGVGFRAQAQGDKLNLSLGFSLRRPRPKSSSAAWTSSWSARSPPKCERTARLSRTRARACATRTK
jgi:large subunit ribosomal protein L6